MTQQKSFKRLVRSRMEKTGESYTAARAVLLAGREGAKNGGRPEADGPPEGHGPPEADGPPEGHAPPEADRPPLATSDEAIRERTGRGWEEWFDLLDEWGAAELPHKEIARRVATQLGVEPLAWNAQAVSVSYERARGLRTVGERSDGFAASASKTVAVPAERLFDAFTGDPPGELRERTATRPRSARYDWGDGASRVHVTFAPKRDGRSTITVEHVRLPDGGEADRMRAHWRERLTALKRQLEES